MTRLYGTNEWQDDLKNILGRAVSSLDQHVVFLFNDSEVNFIYLFYLYSIHQNGIMENKHS